MKRILIFAAVLAVATGLYAQDAYYSVFSYDSFIPSVMINDRAVNLQHDLYPVYYSRVSATSDLRWVRANDSALAAFWTEKGDTILHVMTELSGIAWREQAFDIFLVRYFPSNGSPDPMVVPVGGMKLGDIIEAAPTGNIMRFNLIYQLSQRMLDQTIQPRYGPDDGVAYHPLMRYGPYRRDNLALLLAITVSDNILGMDSTKAAWQSAFWKRRSPGMDVFNKYFFGEWVLTPDHTLAEWIDNEPYGSHLVAVTRPPARPTAQQTVPHKFVEGLPLHGVLGMTVSIDSDGLLEIDTLDTYRLAYANGLRIGDRIRLVDGKRVKTARELVEAILDKLYDGGVTLQIMRGGDVQTLILRPIDMLPADEDSFYNDGYPTLDSSQIDTIDDYAPNE